MAIRLIKIGVLYLAVGICLGIVMGAREQFTLAPVHAHINLLGFVTLTLAGLIYKAFPAAAETRLARIHFWLHNIGLPPFMVALALMLSGNSGMGPVVGILSVVVGGGVLLFIINVWRTLRVQPAAAAAPAALATP
jgi:cbb3-type cytochrome oxidase subunit 1